jgi:hypothetical protein
LDSCGANPRRVDYQLGDPDPAKEKQGRLKATLSLDSYSAG